MTSPSIPVRIERIQSKVKKIMALHQKAKDENYKLQMEKEQLVKTLQQGRAKIEDLEEQNKRVKLARSLQESGETSLDVKLKINEMVREIDKCIAYLNK
jgi:peptidoglycan hydrolase CwlO-like protein